VRKRVVILRSGRKKKRGRKESVELRILGPPEAHHGGSSECVFALSRIFIAREIDRSWTQRGERDY
jgi:hypothetical protein